MNAILKKRIVTARKRLMNMYVNYALKQEPHSMTVVEGRPTFLRPLIRTHAVTLPKLKQVKSKCVIHM